MSMVLLPFWRFLKNIYAFWFCTQAEKVRKKVKKKSKSKKKKRKFLHFLFCCSTPQDYFYLLESRLSFLPFIWVAVSIIPSPRVGHGHRAAPQGSSPAWGAVELRCVQGRVCSATTGKHPNCKVGMNTPCSSQKCVVALPCMAARGFPGSAAGAVHSDW